MFSSFLFIRCLSHLFSSIICVCQVSPDSYDFGSIIYSNSADSAINASANKVAIIPSLQYDCYFVIFFTFLITYLCNSSVFLPFMHLPFNIL